ncbi:hypothetical protein ACFVJ4_38285 [Streptomyces sp. NPDC127178]
MTRRITRRTSRCTGQQTSPRARTGLIIMALPTGMATSPRP